MKLRGIQKIFFVAMASAFAMSFSGGTGAFLFAAEKPIAASPPLHFDFTAEDFDAALKSGKPTFLDISATWCPPCYEAAPAIEELKKTYGGQVNIMTVNYDEQKKLVAKFGVRMLPSFIFFDKGGKKSDVVAGFDSRENLESALKKLLN